MSHRYVRLFRHGYKIQELTYLNGLRVQIMSSVCRHLYVSKLVKIIYVSPQQLQIWSLINVCIPTCMYPQVNYCIWHVAIVLWVRLVTNENIY